MPCSIAWCALTWEAFATLTTGIVAVGGATFIGLRQLKITREQANIAGRQVEVAARQADLLEHQVQVDRAALRANLFERRLDVYKASKAYLRDAMAVRADFDITFETYAALAHQLEQAQFLFSGEVRKKLQEAAALADQLLAEREVLKGLRESVALQAPDGHENMAAQAAKVRDLNKKMRDQLGGLAQDMGDEMRLYIPRL